ncbi:MAG TPA: TolC family protein [Opitutaceae bacterium]|nr:TolC family protein [Opitutaceae bacterium]
MPSRHLLCLALALVLCASSRAQTPITDTEAAKPDPTAKEQVAAPAGTAPVAPSVVNAPTQSDAAPVPAPPPGPTLTLDECIARALDKNFDLRIQHFGTDTAKEDVTIAKADFDPAIELNATRSHSREPRGTPFVDSEGNIITSTPASRDQQIATLGVTQQLITGTTVTASGTLNRYKTDPSVTFFNPSYNSDVALTVRQPLLKNFGIRVNRAQIERAKLGVEIANLDFKSQVLAVVRNVETAYYNLAFAREQEEWRKFSLGVAQSLYEENRSRREVGGAIDLDVLQAQVGVANARRNLLLAQQETHNREDELIAQIQPFGFTTLSIGAVALPNDPVPKIDSDLAYKRARDNTPDYAAAQAALKQLKIDSDVARQNRLPTLDVGGTIGYDAEENSYSRAARNVWGSDGYNWQIDAQLRFPIGLRADRARYRQSLISLHRQEARLEQIDQNVLVQVRAAVRAVQTNQEGVQISSLATELSRRQYEAEKARYESGLSTFRRVQESQADWDNAKVNELQARVNLRNALADLARLEGTSIDRYKIKLAD